MVYLPLKGGILSSFLGKISRAPSGSDGCFFDFLLILQVIPQRFSGIPRPLEAVLTLRPLRPAIYHIEGTTDLENERSPKTNRNRLKQRGSNTKDRIYRFTMANQPTLPERTPP